MSAAAVFAIVAFVVIVAVLLSAATMGSNRRKHRSDELKDQFGPEYGRTIDLRGNRSAAEKELALRKERHDALKLRDLSEREHGMFSAEWSSIQGRFVDDPAGSMTAADLLVERVMQQRGYPVGSFDQREADLSVEHADVLDRYRQAHDIAQRQRAGSVTTEEMRQAMVHFRALFTALLADRSQPAR